jgi:hypothetical protein
MDKLIPVINKLMKVFSNVNIPGIELPRSFHLLFIYLFLFFISCCGWISE